MNRLAFFLMLAGAAPAYAQDHSAHQMPMDQGSPTSRPATSPNADPVDHGQVDHTQSVASAAGQNTTEQNPMPGMTPGAEPVHTEDIPEGPPPPEAFQGPLHAGVPGVDAKVMDSSRVQVMREISGEPIAWFQADRAEFRLHNRRDGYLWDVQGFYGGDINKAWFKSEGEGNFGDNPERAEVQALWSHAIGPWFDLQAGVRQDLVGPARTHAVIGVQGLAPYLFEVDAAVFLSNKGDVTARAEAELDQRITQRLILQPRGEINLAAQDIPELGIGAGLDRIEVGLRLRYEITRRFAPYIGVEQEWRLGRSADYARTAGEHPRQTNPVAGVRFWF